MSRLKRSLGDFVVHNFLVEDTVYALRPWYSDRVRVIDVSACTCRKSPISCRARPTSPGSVAFRLAKPLL